RDWWPALLARYFPGATEHRCAAWDDVIRIVSDGGPDTRAVIWVRRAFDDVEFTGHLVYAHNNDGQVVILDGQSGALATLEAEYVLELRVASFYRPRPSYESLQLPWEQPASGFSAAREKAEAWLANVYGDGVVLVDPGPEDELSRGWLFACTTTRFQKTGDWRDQMLDAALVVPKDREEPFCLDNSAPWEWLDRWDSGVQEL